MISHHPNQFRIKFLCPRLDHVPQTLVGIHFGSISQVTGEHERLDVESTPLEALHKRGEGAIRVDLVIELATGTQEVSVTEVNQDVVGRGVLTESGHGLGFSSLDVGGGYSSRASSRGSLRSLFPNSSTLMSLNVRTVTELTKRSER